MGLPEENLINSFRRSHLAIERTVDRILTGIRLYPVVRQLLPELREQLAAHLQRQDSRFFKALMEHFADDRQVLKMLEFLEYDLKSIKVEALEFFDKYSTNFSDIVARNFPIDFKKFADSILNHIAEEKQYVLPLLHNLADESGHTETV